MIKFSMGIITILTSLWLCVPAFAQSTSSDEQITKDVQNHISADKSLTGNGIKIHTEKGIVSLTGTVNSDTQASNITEIAQSISGVKDVNTDHLTVKDSKHPVKDSFITGKIKGLFIQEKLFGDKDIAAIGIHVETKDGVVFLSGTADTRLEIDNAEKIAKTVSGVKKVVNTVKISNDTHS